MKSKRQFVAYFFFQKWTYIQFGFHISLDQPNIEIHVPFGFFRIGFVETYGGDCLDLGDFDSNTFGIKERPWQEWDEDEFILGD